MSQSGQLAKTVSCDGTFPLCANGPMHALKSLSCDERAKIEVNVRTSRGDVATQAIVLH